VRATADGEGHAGLPGERDSSGDVASIRRADDQRRPSVGLCMVDRRASS